MHVINRTSSLLVLFLLFFTLNTKAQNSPIRSGTDFFTIYTEPNKWINFVQTPSWGNDTNAFSELFVLGANTSCFQVEIPHLNYIVGGQVQKDSVVRLLLPYNPRFPADSVVPNVIFIHSSRPVTIIQGSSLGVSGSTTDRPIGVGQGTPLWHRLIEGEATSLIPNNHYTEPFLFLANAALYYSFGEFVSGSIYSLYSAGTNCLDLIPATDLSFPIGGTSNFHLADTPFTICFYDQGIWFNGVRVHTGTDSLKTINESLLFPNTFFLFKSMGFNLVPLEWNIQLGGSNCYSFEETKPLGYGGYEFHSPPLQGNIGNTYSLHAGADSTVFRINGGNPIRLDSLQRFDTCVTGPTIIRSNNPLYGYMGPCSDPTFNNNGYSPFSVTLNADTELMTESLFATFEEPDTNNHYALSVVLPTAAIPGFLLNGQNPPNNVFQAFPTDAAWSYAQFDLNPGTHKVVCPGGFHGYHYTWYQDTTTTGQFPSYGYNLAQSIVWPEDSLVPMGATQPNSLSPWDSLSIDLCPGDSFYFQAPPFRHTTWQWDLGDGQSLKQVSDEHPASLLSYSWDQTGTFWLVLSDSLGCSLTDSLLITVQGQPDAQFNSQVLTSCAGATVALSAMDPSADSYQWSWPRGGASGPSASFQYSGESDSIMVSLVVTAQDCADSTTQFITIPPSKQLPEDLPNVITPNGDLQNDVFSFDELTSFEGCYSLRVFNRWGALVHEGTDVFSPFDGTDINGRELSDGVYFYQLELGQTRFQGEIHLFR